MNQKMLSGNNLIEKMGVGIMNSFYGTWSTDVTWQEMLSKDIRSS
jgi:hypothetical protein